MTYHDGKHYNSLRKLEEKTKTDEEKKNKNSEETEEDSEESDDDSNDVSTLISKVDHLNI